ncbi:MAG: hypothetical protein RIC35_13980 [Marinoscillum sp.]
MTSSPVGSGILSLAITADLLITVPLIYYLLVRNTKIPNTTTIPVLIIGMVLGSYFLAAEEQLYLELFKTWILPLIEVTILTVVIVKVRKAINKYKALEDRSPDFYTTLKYTCAQILPKKLVMPFATEVAVIYYGLINWKSRKLQENEFTHHKESGTPALMGAFVFIILTETITFHLLLDSWNTVVAWIFTGLSLYTALQVIGFAKSLAQRPITINQNSITLKYGILNEVEIPFTELEDVELSTKELEKAPQTKTLSPLGGLESHNVVLYLKSEHELIGLYGLKKRFTVLALHVDKPQEFHESLHAEMTNL